MHDSREIVLQVIRRLTAEHGSAEYGQIIREAGISPHIVKDRCSELVDLTHDIERVGRGVYRALKRFPAPRAITKTMLPDGEVALEIGDHVINLTPQEDKMLRGMYGSAPIEIYQQPAHPAPVEQPRAAYITLADIAEMLRMPIRQARERVVNQPGFPQPCPGAVRRKRWPASEVEKFIGGM